MEKTLKKQNRKPRPRQLKGAKALVKNLLSDKPLPTGKVLESVGYSQTLSQDPQRIIDTKGFQMALSDIGLREALEKQGINPQKIAEKIDVLLNATDKIGLDDYTAIDKGLKHATAIYGVVPDKPPETKTTYNFIFSADVQEKVREVNEHIKQMLTKPHDKEN